MTPLPDHVTAVPADAYLAALADPEFCPEAPDEQEEDNPFLSAQPLSAFLKETLDIRWIVDGLVAGGSIAVFYGKPKSGKSVCTRNLAACVAAGRPFLGRAVTRGRVLYLALEESREHLQDQWRKMGLTGEEQANIEVFADRVGSIDDVVGKLAKAVSVKKFDVVIIDTLFRFIRVQDEKAYAEANRAMDPLLDLAHGLKIAIVAVHHERKGGGDHGDGMLGSTGYFGSIDVGIKIERDGRDKRFISSEHRMGTPFEKAEIVMDSASGFIGIGATMVDSSMAATASFILQVLDERGEASRADLEAVVGMDKTLFSNTLRDLRARGVVSQRQVGKAHFYSLPDASLHPETT